MSFQTKQSIMLFIKGQFCLAQLWVLNPDAALPQLHPCIIRMMAGIFFFPVSARFPAVTTVAALPSLLGTQLLGDASAPLWEGLQVRAGERHDKAGIGMGLFMWRGHFCCVALKRRRLTAKC